MARREFTTATRKAALKRSGKRATVATILEHEDGCLEIVKLDNGKYQLTNCSIELSPEHFAMLGSIAHPSPQPSGPRCEECQQEIALDVDVPDHLWAQISPKPVEGFKGGGLLCPQCIVDRLSALAAQDAAALLARRIINAILVHGFENNPDAEGALRAQEPLVAALLRDKPKNAKGETA